MREISVRQITQAVAEGFVQANLYLPKGLQKKIEECARTEAHPTAKTMFQMMKDNLAAAHERQIPICQDCGMAVVFAEIGQEVHITGGDFTQAVNDGIAQGYTRGYLRKSVVADPINRENTGDNTPGILYTRLVPGEHITLTLAPKGFGSENMSALKMFNPTAGVSEIVDFAVNTVKSAGAKPCPPLVVGIGIGGDFEYCAYLSKKALCRDTEVSNSNPFYAALEQEITEKINALGIGAQGFGGSITALKVAIEVYPTHIAGLPVAVNIGCHVTRHITVTL